MRSRSRALSRLVLLLNLAILVVNFFLSLGATETQAKVLRTTARVAYSEPIVRSAPQSRPSGEAGEARGVGLEIPMSEPLPLARLAKFLVRARELDGLSASQMAALYRTAIECHGELARGGEELRTATWDGARARRWLGDVHQRVRRRAADALRAAAVPEGEPLARLVRLVMASAG